MPEFDRYVRKLKETPVHKIKTHTGELAGYGQTGDIARYFSRRPLYVAVHIVSGAQEEYRDYGILHSHPFPEVNILAAPPNELVFRIRLGSEERDVPSPAEIFIPAGLEHSANLVRGTGAFVVLRLEPGQKESK